MSLPPRLHGSQVRVSGLGKSYGDVVAVRDFSVTVEAGEFFTVLGPSGSGKTTVMMMIAGFIAPSSGAIEVDGRDVAALPPQKRGLGMVFQNYAVFPHLTVYENVAFPLKVRGRQRAEIEGAVGDMLELVRLGGLGGRMPRELSGGQQQRVALARALVFKPSVLLMDEPLGALDKKLRDHMQVELRRIHTQLGVTVVYVTHDQGEALTMSDRIAIMDHGRLEQVGTPGELYDEPATRFIADFLGETNFLPGTVEDRTTGGVRVSGAGCSFEGACADSAIARGTKVVVAVRPEKIRMTRAGHPDVDALTAVVREASFSGDVIRYRVATPEGDSIQVTRQNRLDVESFQVGEPVSLAWNPREARVLRD